MDPATKVQVETQLKMCASVINNGKYKYREKYRIHRAPKSVNQS